MKYGMSNKVLSTIFSISRSSLRCEISSVREALIQTFVPRNLGLQHITREDVIQKHTRPLAQTIFSDATNSLAKLVLDGTYIYIYVYRKAVIFSFKEEVIACIKDAL